jgi:hypothetical protein
MAKSQMALGMRPGDLISRRAGTKVMAKSQMALGMRPGNLISRRADILIFDHILVSGIKSYYSINKFYLPTGQHIYH